MAFQVEGVRWQDSGEVLHAGAEPLLDVEVAAEPKSDLAEELVLVDHRRFLPDLWLFVILLDIAKYNNQYLSNTVVCQS